RTVRNNDDRRGSLVGDVGDLQRFRQPWVTGRHDDRLATLGAGRNEGDDPRVVGPEHLLLRMQEEPVQSELTERARELNGSVRMVRIHSREAQELARSV